MIDLASLSSLLTFWLAASLCGWLAWPLANMVLPGESDAGYLAAKPLGWLFGAYAAWIAGVFGVPFAQTGWVVGLMGLVMLFAATVRRSFPLPPLPRILTWETGSFLALLVGVLIKARMPDINGLEKFMDFAFVNAALRAQSLPPVDPWWGGEAINYYYFGHLAAAWLIQLARVPADHGFNLMVGLVFAYTATLGYRIVAGCLEHGRNRIATICGAMAAVLVTLGGNFHSVLYDVLRPWSGTTSDVAYYFPDSTRFVGFDPPTGDKGFTEMPAYGFAVGDLHAHLINLPTAFLIALILLRVVQRRWEKPALGRFDTAIAASLALLFAICAMANSWDAVSYGVMMGLVGFILWAGPGKFGLKSLVRLILAGAAIVTLAVLMALPFLLNFEPIASSTVWWDGNTPLWQLAVLYGHVAVPLVILLVGPILPAMRTPSWLAGSVLAGTAAALLLLPEIFYVKDIYGDDFRRANTMFKFAFQGQPLAVMAAAISVGLLLQSRKVVAVLSGLLLAIPLLAPLSYAGRIYGGTLAEIGSTTFTLDGLRFLDPADLPLLNWLASQPTGAEIMLVEAPGESFTYGARLSAMSGVPAVLGWRGHEYLWRGADAGIETRFDAISKFYASPTLAEACAFLVATGATHVAIGPLERETYPGLSIDILTRLGTIVVGDSKAMIVAVEQRRCEA